MDSVHPGQLRGAPIAPRVPSVRELHGDAVPDDYAWMHGGDAALLHEDLAAERAFYDAEMTRLDGLAAKLAAEAASRTPTGDEYSVSWSRGGFAYRTRTPFGADNEQLLRAVIGSGDERVVLDDNLAAARTGFAQIGVREPSPDGNLLAWSLDSTGAEVFELRVRDLRTGEELPEVIERTYAWAHWWNSVAWSTDSRHLFYVVPDELMRPFQVWRHELGTSPAADALVYEEPDGRFHLGMHASRSRDVAIITARSRDTTEVRLIDLDHPTAAPVPIEPRRRGTEYWVDHARTPDGVGALFVRSSRSRVARWPRPRVSGGSRSAASRSLRQGATRGCTASMCSQSASS
jgi:oligopeptidase B